jgi:hypothetical protein
VVQDLLLLLQEVLLVIHLFSLALLPLEEEVVLLDVQLLMVCLEALVVEEKEVVEHQHALEQEEQEIILQLVHLKEIMEEVVELYLVYLDLAVAEVEHQL